MSDAGLLDGVGHWAEREVAAGRAASLAAARVAYEAEIAAFRTSLDRAVEDSEREGYVTHEEVFAELERLYPDEG